LRLQHHVEQSRRRRSRAAQHNSVAANGSTGSLKILLTSQEKSGGDVVCVAKIPFDFTIAIIFASIRASDQSHKIRSAGSDDYPEFLSKNGGLRTPQKSNCSL
jgi:hypothetical protein